MNETPDSPVYLEPVTRKTVDDYIKIQGLAGQATPEEVERFAALAVRYQLNPFQRELHLVGNSERGQRKFVAVVGYEVYLRKAERTHKLDGWKAWTEGEGEKMKAVLEVYRADWAHPFVHEVHFEEAVQRQPDGSPTAFWQRMPKFQLRKVCISQGFRLCFAEELGGIPYEAVELNAEDAVVQPATSPARPKEPVAAQATSETGSFGTVGDELIQFLTANEGMFTKKHLQWIRDRIAADPSNETKKKMISYARRVVSQGGDAPEQPRASRSYGNRTQRKPDLMPTF
ncbi:MAG: recombinase RecT [Spirochaetales bacterium]